MKARYLKLLTNPRQCRLASEQVSLLDSYVEISTEGFRFVPFLYDLPRTARQSSQLFLLFLKPELVFPCEYLITAFLALF